MQQAQRSNTVLLGLFAWSGPACRQSLDLPLDDRKRANMLGAISSLRFATRTLVLSRTQQCRPTHRHAFRTFSTTPRRLTAEVSDDFINSIKDTPLYKKLEDSPNALKALSDLYTLTKEMGAVLFRRLSHPRAGVNHPHVRKVSISMLRTHLPRIRCSNS